MIYDSHRFAGFAVLKSPDVPSILMELGYLSNEADEKDLGSEAPPRSGWPRPSCGPSINMSNGRRALSQS